MTSSYLIRKKLLPFRDHSTNSSGGVGTSKVGPVMTGRQVRTPINHKPGINLITLTSIQAKKNVELTIVSHLPGINLVIQTSILVTTMVHLTLITQIRKLNSKSMGSIVLMPVNTEVDLAAK